MEAHAPVFDTHKAVKTLRNAGAQEPLAEAVVDTIEDAIGKEVATKGDLALLRAELTVQINAAGNRTLMIALGILGPLMVAGFGYIGYMIQLLIQLLGS